LFLDFLFFFNGYINCKGLFEDDEVQNVTIGILLMLSGFMETKKRYHTTVRWSGSPSAEYNGMVIRRGSLFFGLSKQNPLIRGDRFLPGCGWLLIGFCGCA
jgi:hypothetical protein